MTNPSTKPTINYEAFVALDLRVGEIVSATVPDWSEKLIEFKVNFGQELGERTILAGVKQHYQPEDFVGKKFIFVINLAERQMGKSVSQGMMLMALDNTALDNSDKPIKLDLPSQVPIGAEIC